MTLKHVEGFDAYVPAEGQPGRAYSVAQDKMVDVGHLKLRRDGDPPKHPLSVQITDANGEVTFRLDLPEGETEIRIVREGDVIRMVAV